VCSFTEVAGGNTSRSEISHWSQWDVELKSLREHAELEKHTRDPDARTSHSVILMREMKKKMKKKKERGLFHAVRCEDDVNPALLTARVCSVTAGRRKSPLVQTRVGRNNTDTDTNPSSNPLLHTHFTNITHTHTHTQYTQVDWEYK